MGYVVAGFIFGMERFDPDMLLYALMAIYLAGIGLIGFREETEAPWRRGFGTFGSIVSLFFLSFEFSSDDSIFRYITWMFIGIVAFGFGILYMNRLGEISNLYDVQEQTQPAPEQTMQVSEPVAVDEVSTQAKQEPEVIDIDE